MEIVAVGARTPVGLTAETTAAAVRGGISRLREFPFANPGGEPIVVAADGQLATSLEGRERLLPMLQHTLDQVMRKLAQGKSHRGKTQVFLVLPEERPGFSGRDATWVSGAVHAAFRAQQIEVEVETKGRGHAGGIRAVEAVVRDCAGSPRTLFLVLGVDSYHHPETLLWLERRRQCSQPGVRGGFFPGEGAACLALAGADLRARLGLPGLAAVRGAQTAREARLRDSETGSLGVGATQAVQGATAGLELPKRAVDAVYIDINGERYRSEEWGFVAMRTGQAFKSFKYEAPADCWGDVGAAWAPLAGALVVQSFARGYAPGPRALVLAGSEGGMRGAMLLERISR
ncbi:MAG TPA: hypothetical protein VIG99_19430 [Myxococcaceae bacterium]